MTPIIYEATATGTDPYNDAGLGYLSDAIECTVDEQLNGNFTLSLTYPANGNNAQYLVKFNKIRVDVGSTLKNQIFTIKQVTQNLNGEVTVYAEHISYLTNDLGLKTVQTVTGDAQQILTSWKNQLLEHGNLFTVYSDIESTNTSHLGFPDFANARIALGGQDGSVLDLFHGEYKFDNLNISLLKQRGKASGATIRYGKNLTDFNQETNLSEVYTSIVPYAKLDAGDNNQVLHYLSSYYLDCDNASEFPNRVFNAVDFSDKFGTETGQITYSDANLKSLALQYMKDNDFGKPKISITVNTIDLAHAWGSDAPTDDIELADIVNVFFEEYGINETAECTEAVWNVLSEQYTSYTFGDRPTTLGESLSSDIKDAQNKIDSVNDQVVQLVDGAGHTNFYINSGDPLPVGKNEGDTLWVKNGDADFSVYTWERGTDGTYSWQPLISTKTADLINSQVNSAQSSMSEYVDSQNAVVSSDVASASTRASQAVTDAQNAIAAANAVNATASDAWTNVNNALSKANSALSANSQLSSSISQQFTATNSEVASKVDQTEFNSLKETVTDQGTAITQTQDAVTAKADKSYVDTLNSTVQSQGAEITANANAITQKVDQTDYNTLTGNLQSQINTVTDTANSHTQTISSLQTQVNDLGQTNLINNSDFNPDIGNWIIWQNSDYGSVLTNLHQINNRNTVEITNSAGWMGPRLISQPIPLRSINSPISLSFMYYVFSGTTSSFQLQYLDDNNNDVGYQNYVTLSGTGWQTYMLTNVSLSIPDGATHIAMLFDARDYGKLGVAEPMLVNGSTIGAYVAGQYVGQTQAQQSSWQQTIDGITGTVSKKVDGDTFTSYQQQTANEFNNYLQTSVYNSDKQTIDNNISGISQKADSITQFVQNSDGSLANSFMSALENTTLMQGVDGSQSILSQTSNQITWALQNQKVGGNNLLANTQDYSGWIQRSNYAGGIEDSPDSRTRVIHLWNASNNSFSNNDLAAPNSVHLIQGHSYTFSAKLSLFQTDADIDIIVMSEYTADVANVETPKLTSHLTGTLTTYSVTFTAQATGDYGGWCVGKWGDGTWPSGSLFIGEIQLQEGNMATPWSPNYQTDLVPMINLQAGTTLIQNDKLYLNADSIVFGGEAFMTNAMINDVSASKLTAGTIDASWINVINLDANNITANAANFFTTQWQNNYGNRVAINADNINLLSATGSNLTIAANSLHFSSTSGSYYSVNDFGSWKDSNGNATSATGLYTGVRGGNNSFWSLLTPGGATILLYAGSSMDDGANNNILNNNLNSYVNINLWGALHFYGYENNDPTYISVDSVRRTMNFYTSHAKNGDGNYFWFNQDVYSAGTFSGSSRLSLKENIKTPDISGLDELNKMQLIMYNYKSNPDKQMLSPVIDDINKTPQYYLPYFLNNKGIGVDLYSYTSLVALGLKEEDAKVEQLKNRIDILEATNANLQAQINALSK